MTITLPASAKTKATDRKPLIVASIENKRRKTSTIHTAGSVLRNSNDENNSNISLAAFTSKGFQTAASFLQSDGDKKEDSIAQVELENASARPADHVVTAGPMPVAEAASKSQENDVEVHHRRTIDFNLKIRGVKHYAEWHDILQRLLLKRDSALGFHREPTNEHDPNAIQVILMSKVRDNNCKTDTESTNNKIGYVAREQAEVLAPLLDQGHLSFSTVELVRAYRTTVGIRVTLTTTLSEASTKACLKNQPGMASRIDIEQFLNGRDFAQMDLDVSHSSPYTLPDLGRLLPWRPAICESVSRRSVTSKPSYLELEHGWPTNHSRHPTSASVDEYKAAEDATWPPSDQILAKLGLGASHDKEWWKQTAGLLPPSDWVVHGAFDLVGTGSFPTTAPVTLKSPTQVQRVTEALDGAIHGITNVWCEDTLLAIRQTMHQEHFWLARKGDAFIRAFGGPYVLGQKVNDLHLLLGAPHNALTARICRAHNLVYTAVHLEFPVAPGFNTIIFGLNLHRSGFHYHQDSMGELTGKNAPLLPKQPVVTTVFYEKPMEDNGKDCVFWKPLLNFSPQAPSSSSSSSFNNSSSSQLYLAARALPTIHGQVHVQRAGLQKIAQHGIFHTPLAAAAAAPSKRMEQDVSRGPRKGYRVAITARITHSDAIDRLGPFLQRGVYEGVWGPEGNKTLP